MIFGVVPIPPLLKSRKLVTTTKDKIDFFIFIFLTVSILGIGTAFMIKIFSSLL